MGLAGGDGAGEGVRVHVAEHQHLAGGGVAGDDRDEPAGIEAGSEPVAFLDLGDALACGKRPPLSGALVFVGHVTCSFVATPAGPAAATFHFRSPLLSRI